MIAVVDWVNLAGTFGIILTAVGTILTVVAKGRSQLNKVEGAVTTASGAPIENAGTVLREWLSDLQRRLGEVEARERECQRELARLRRMIGGDVDRR